MQRANYSQSFVLQWRVSLNLKGSSNHTHECRDISWYAPLAELWIKPDMPTSHLARFHSQTPLLHQSSFMAAAVRLSTAFLTKLDKEETFQTSASLKMAGSDSQSLWSWSDMFYHVFMDMVPVSCLSLRKSPTFILSLLFFHKFVTTRLFAKLHFTVIVMTARQLHIIHLKTFILSMLFLPMWPTLSLLCECLISSRKSKLCLVETQASN